MRSQCFGMIEILKILLCWLRGPVLLCGLCFGLTSLGQEHAKASYMPPQGIVPDKTTAIRLAEVILTPIYGKAAVQNQKPLSAHLDKGIWVVQEKVAPGQLIIE